MPHVTLPAGLALCLLLTAFPIRAQTTLYSQANGAWNAVNLWNTAPDGSGAFVQTPDNPNLNIVVQSGHTVTLNASGYSMHNLTVQTGASLRVGAGTLRYLQVYGTEASIFGALGGAGDGLGLDVNGPACTLAGNGSIQLTRLRKNCNDAASADVTDLTVACNVVLSWSSSASLLCDGNPSNSMPCTFNLTLNPGYTITAAGDVSIDGINGLSNNTWQDGTFTIHGTLDVADDLYLNTQNPSGGDVTYHIGTGGKIVVRSQVLGNAGAGGAALANLVIDAGGTLELRGSNTVCVNLSTARNTFTLDPASTVWYNSGSAQTVEPLLPYGILRAGGGGLKNLDGETAVVTQLWLDGSTVQLLDHNLLLGGATLTGATASTYVRTNGIGALWRDVGATAVVFPVGNSAYNQAVLENIGSPDGFGVRVFDEVLSDGESGYTYAAGVVNRSWVVQEAAPYDSEVKLTLQWRQTHELPGFNRNACYVSSYENSGWSGGLPGPAAGANPYMRARSGQVLFYVFAVGSGTALPVELVSFTGEKQGENVVLRWRTGSETNNAYFAVERSVSGVNFQEIGRVAGQGTSTTARDYTFADSRPPEGLVYYRLRQTDGDGSYTYSPVIAVDAGPGPPVTGFPSPARNRVTFVLQEEAVSDGVWEVSDMQGAVVASGVWNEGGRQLPLDVEGLPPGWYVFRMVLENRVLLFRFVKG